MSTTSVSPEPPTPTPASSEVSGQSSSKSGSVWVSVVCALISAASAGWATYSNNEAQTKIEALKTKTEQQTAQIKADTEKQIATIKAESDERLKQSEFRSQENLVRLKDSLETEKETRLVQQGKCEEMKAIRDKMSTNLTHIKWNDDQYRTAASDLESAINKISSYASGQAISVVESMLPKSRSPDPVQADREYFEAFLEGYNSEIRHSCTK